MLRSDRRTDTGPARLLLLAALGITTALPTVAATEQAFQSRSTLAPTVAPQNLSLDAAIASMVKRRVIADVTPQAPGARKPSAPRSSATKVASKAISATASPVGQPESTALKSTPGWRAAGQKTPDSAPSDAPATELGFPTLPPSSNAARSETLRLAPAVEVPTPDDLDAPEANADDGLGGPSLPSANLHDADDDPQIDAPVNSSEDAIKEAFEQADDHRAEAEDELAPIDEASETPAPAHDAPGDPIEPEYTGPAEAPVEPRTAAASKAKPLPGAGPIIDSASLPAGEPDRHAEPDLTLSPSNPEDFEEADEPTTAGKRRPLTRNQRALRDKVRNVLKYYYARPLNTGDRSPWEVMHMMLSYEVHSQVRQGGPQGEPITAVGWLCFNQPCRNRSLMYLNEDGDLRVKVGPALQGHQGQLLALLAQARVKSDYPIKVEGKDFTIADLIEMEKLTCYPRTELTFKLIGLQRYLDINARWVNDQGMQWDFPTLIREEIRQPVRTAACGGTHRLSGLTLAVKKRRNSGLPITGEYAQAQQLVAQYQNYAYRLQNSDGSFSTDWFKGPGAEPDIDRRLKTTGHQLEWLLYAASEEQLTYHRTVRAVNYLANIMHANRGRDWEAGPLGHAIHALVLYDRMVFAKYDNVPASEQAPVAERSPRQQQRRTRR
jgi:hypothetical protein